ncbi:hypothetical protein BWQ96_10005 [Gracilariopsis chorda]|uniref:Uncharacterized protein n=1 Tax=Gracilariopsis chorda TaxID=448386 RepID=A0A2V3IDX7_9FLOR|nr:hypothetical protein BWQ96_10005 [Gracilariopsis chorda]|eukprot:PXF40285.1 hypothetical protein BWQ96_10005 [Gracilariopsis chorda]
MSAPSGDKRLTTDVHYDMHHGFRPDHNSFRADSSLETQTDIPHLQTPQSSKEHSEKAEMPQNPNFDDEPLPQPASLNLSLELECHPTQILDQYINAVLPEDSQPEYSNEDSSFRGSDCQETDTN